MTASMHFGRVAVPLWLALVLHGGACVDPGTEGAPDAGAEVVGQGSDARGALVINELAPRPLEGPDWVELLNRSDEAVDLCDYFLSDSVGRLDHYHHLGGSPPPASCEPRLLDAGDYLVVYASDDIVSGPDHAPFKLGVADELHILSTRGETVDSLVYLFEERGQSLGRQPDGEGIFYAVEHSEGVANPLEVEPSE